MNALLPQAVHLLSYVNSGESFIIQDLFPGVIWKKLSQTEKRTLESAFSKHISKNIDLGIKTLDEIQYGHQVYVRI